MANDIQIREFQANGFTFRCRTCGLEQQGELVVFLHGYPETSITWEPAMRAFAEKGYRCLAPNQRGYSPGARPEGLENYTHRKLASDVIALVDQVNGGKKFHLVGHDWGSNVGWIVVTLYPERVQSYTALSTPHTKEYLQMQIHDPVQHQRSQYIFNYLEADKPEEAIAANNFERFRKLFEGFPQATLDEYLTTFAEKSARTAAINWYRAKYKQALGQVYFEEPVPYGDVELPVLFIWGKKDLYTAPVGVEAGHKYMKGYYRFIQIDAGHWLMEFNTDFCVKQMLEHVASFPIGG